MIEFKYGINRKGLHTVSVGFNDEENGIQSDVSIGVKKGKKPIIGAALKLDQKHLTQNDVQENKEAFEYTGV